MKNQFQASSSPIFKANPIIDKINAYEQINSDVHCKEGQIKDKWWFYLRRVKFKATHDMMQWRRIINSGESKT